MLLFFFCLVIIGQSGATVKGPKEGCHTVRWYNVVRERACRFKSRLEDQKGSNVTQVTYCFKNIQLKEELTYENVPKITLYTSICQAN